MKHKDPVFWLSCVILTGALSGIFCLGMERKMPPTDPTELSAVPSSESGIVTLSTTQPAIPAEPLHILLIGTDTAEEDAAARADAMILGSILPEEGMLVLTSFLRDLYVEIPGHGSDRLNAAYAWGGMPLLKQTLAENFGITVQGCLEADFSRFPKIIDLLGGVEIPLRQDEAEAINRVTGDGLTSGCQRLDGDAALAYSRIRKLDGDGDFSRTRRQRTLLEAMLRQCGDAGTLRIGSALLKLLPLIHSDLSRQDLMSLVSGYFPGLTELTVVSQQVPADDAFAYRNIGGKEVILADMEKARQMLKETLKSP